MAEPLPGGLFSNQRETNLASTVVMIEDVLIELGHFVNDCRDPLAGALPSWRIVKGSATVRISLLDRPEFTHLRVASAVLHLDEQVDRRALFAHLLEVNAELCGAAFALRGDQVIIVVERSTLDLDRSEVMELIDRVRHYADDYDDRLAGRFGGTMGGDL
jgi:hypothetical protein